MRSRFWCIQTYVRLIRSTIFSSLIPFRPYCVYAKMEFMSRSAILKSLFLPRTRVYLLVFVENISSVQDRDPYIIHIKRQLFIRYRRYSSASSIKMLSISDLNYSTATITLTVNPETESLCRL